MIPRAEVIAVAGEAGLLPTTVEKDYALGWVLFGIARHPDLGRWILKGGTCLKKCFFDTYRFSEDLDFTIPPDVPYDAEAIRVGLLEVGEWVRDQTGIELPPDGIEVEESINKRGERTYLARATFFGPMPLQRAQRQRIRFDLTQDEVVVDEPGLREVFHGYSDAPESLPSILCYSLNEILAEKIRALHERAGRARDVYDVVNVGRNLRADILPDRTRAISAEKFAFKGLAPPTPAGILARIDIDVLAVDWAKALRHQLPVLPPVGEFVDGLRELLDWLLAPEKLIPHLSALPQAPGETVVPPVRFARPAAVSSLGRGGAVAAPPSPAGLYGSGMDRVRFAARNRLLAWITYHGVTRLVEPYSLRMPKTGNLLLYVFEVERGSGPGEGIKSYKVGELGEVVVTDRPFQAQYLVEL